MQKQHYIIITPFFPTEEDFRGPFIYDQAKALCKHSGYEVNVIKIVNKGSSHDYTYQGINVHVVKIKDLPTFLLPGLVIKHNTQQVIKKLQKITQNNVNGIALVHGHVTYPCGVLAVSVASKINAKSIVQHHGLDVMGYTNGCFGNLLFKKINRLWINKRLVPLLNMANMNVGVSKQTLNSLKDIKGYKSTLEYVYYNGVDTTKFFKIEGVKNADFFTIGCVGNFWETKDQITLIKAFHSFIERRTIKKTVLKLIGTGVTLSSCKEYVHKNGLQQNVLFLDTVDHVNLNSFYNSLDLFVLPSYDEAFGCVYTEAYTCGVPFIGVFNQGIEEMILPQNKDKQLILKSDVQYLETLIYNYYIGNNKLEPLCYDTTLDALTLLFLKELQLKFKNI